MTAPTGSSPTTGASPSGSTRPGAFPPRDAPAGLSEFVAKILDQLSLSAWLPGTVLVLGITLILQLWSQNDRDLVEAVTSFSDQSFAFFAALVIGVIAATTVTQAFEFEFIRVLEGYWGSGLVGSSLSSVAISLQSRKRRLYEARLTRRNKRAFYRTRPLLLKKPRQVVDYWENDVLGKPSIAPPGFETVPLNGWHLFADPRDMRGLEALRAKQRSFPRVERILPTSLGNTLRSYERSVPAKGFELEAFILDNTDDIPGALREQHDQFRTRLDMYCTLVLVFLVLALGGGFALGGRVAWPFGLQFGIFCLLISWVCYRAAIASAHGYGVVLVAIAKTLKSSGRTSTT